MNYNAIEKALHEKHMSRRQLAKELGIPSATFNAAMNRKAKGGVLSSIDTLRSIGSILDIDLYELMIDDDVRKELEKIPEGQPREIGNTEADRQILYYQDAAFVSDLLSEAEETLNNYGKVYGTPEDFLLKIFRELNAIGKVEAIKRMLEMTQLESYSKDLFKPLK